jgi:hypothetical protein
MKHLLIALLLFTSTAKNTQHMKAFIVLVKVPNTYTTELAKSVNPQWEKTIADWKASGHYITSFAYPGESKVIASGTTEKENMKQVSSILLRAENIDEATELAKACPILKYGGSVEIREIPKGEPQIFAPNVSEEHVTPAAANSAPAAHQQ